MLQRHAGKIAFTVLAVVYLIIAGIATADLLSSNAIRLAFLPSCALAIIALLALVVLTVTRFKG